MTTAELNTMIAKLEAEKTAWPKSGATLRNPAFTALIERIAYLKAQVA